MVEKFHYLDLVMSIWLKRSRKSQKVLMGSCVRVCDLPFLFGIFFFLQLNANQNLNEILPYIYLA